MRKSQNHDWRLAVSFIRAVRECQLNSHLSFKMLIKMKIFRYIITLNCYVNNEKPLASADQF